MALTCFSGQVPPSLNGYPGKGRGPHPGHRPGHGREEGRTGKVSAILYDRFGDFKGFRLRTESGEELAFHAHEPDLESLIRRAWEERWLITVEPSGHDHHWPRAVILRRPGQRIGP